MFTEGQTVTIKVRNILYDVRHRYANGWVGPEFNEYTGTIMREKWFLPNEIGITTGDPKFPFRRINLERIVEVNDAAVDFAPADVEERQTKTVQGSKGQTYVVTKDHGKVYCSCPGFTFRKTCKHVQEFA